MAKVKFPPSRMRGEKREVALEQFAEQLKQIGKEVGFKVSARGWCLVIVGIVLCV